MKSKVKIRENIERWMERVEERWYAMPVKKQRIILLYFFAGYVVVTFMVVIAIVFGRGDNRIKIDHIENPVKTRVSPAKGPLLPDSTINNQSHGK